MGDDAFKRKIRNDILSKTTREDWLNNFFNFLASSIKKLNDDYTTNINKYILFNYSKYNNFDTFFEDYINCEIEYNENSLEKVNILLDIFINTEVSFKTKRMKWTIFFKDKKDTEEKFESKLALFFPRVDDVEKIYNEFIGIIVDCSYFLLYLKNDDLTLIFINEKYLIDEIDEYDKNLAEIFYDYKSSKSFKEKEKNMGNLVDKIVFIFDENKSSKATNFFYEKIGKKETIDFRKKLNGYFRHTPNDSNGNEVKEWVKFSEAEKERIMEEMFVDILYYCVLLRINGININKIN